ncbi:PQQ-binding-like beta-propeller repeat protein [Galbibacter sp. BG1]|uniref:outer membrane protein assembly factor BamB family protein n=1 Tax=Galbibacter sp. BG1 TaxID=1170699 RepID=UPI0015BEB262|nr:PQQ-binding-like beta-propeller repeat protein [Galbibacter sp. BG1]QLE02461.1 PQQ-binding-like beta-propeller repeat protein [Galbibacter sp. BG1]
MKTRFKVKMVLLAFVIGITLQAQETTFKSSGSEEIDNVRRTIKKNPTGADNFRKRSVLMYMWLGSLQQLGADLSSFFDTDTEYYRLEGIINRSKGDEKEVALKKMGNLIDKGYAELEVIYRDYITNGPVFKPFESDGKNFPSNGNMNTNWSMFQANEHNNGYTDAPGAKFGKQAWKYPIGLGWYSRPVIEKGKVYIASPGMYTTSFCLDLNTGKEIWRSTQEHPLFGIYKYPAIMSTPVIQEDKIILREVNSHGGNKGQAKHLVYIDKNTGETLSRKYAGHVDYRTQNAPVASNGNYVVYPFGVADIYSYPPICQNFNRLICKDQNNEKLIWDFNVGDIDALAEPVITDNMVFQGTMEGYLYALNIVPGTNDSNHVDLSGTNEDQLIAWNFKADGAINTKVLLENGRIFFGSNGGTVYCLDEKTGEKIWSINVPNVELRARKHFTSGVIHNNTLYMGAANNRLYSIDSNSGKINWEIQTEDWIRSNPVILDSEIHVADISGNLYQFSKKGERNWQKQISTHPIYADLTAQDGKIVLNDSNLMTYCLNTEGDVVWKHSILDAYYKENGERIYTDQLSGGTYYQSKPTAADGLVYFGNPAGFLFGLDADTGKEKWKFEMGGAISVGAAIQDGKIYAGQQGGERFFYCLDAKTGELVWKQTVPGGWVWGSATVDDGMVYVPTVNGYAVCLDGETGNIIWMYPTAKSVPAEPAVDGDLVYFGSWSRSLYAFNKKTGEIVWKANGIGLDSGTLIAKDGKIYLPHHNNIFMYFDAQTGKVLNDGNKSKKDKGNYSNFNASPAFHDGRGFFTARVGIGLKGVPLTSKVYAVDAETAKVHWTFPDGGGLSAPALASGKVFIGSGNYPYLYALEQKTGKPYWIYKMGARVEESTLCIYRDKVYALSGDGYLHAVK